MDQPKQPSSRSTDDLTEREYAERFAARLAACRAEREGSDAELLMQFRRNVQIAALATRHSQGSDAWRESRDGHLYTPGSGSDVEEVSYQDELEDRRYDAEQLDRRRSS